MNSFLSPVAGRLDLDTPKLNSRVSRLSNGGLWLHIWSGSFNDKIPLFRVRLLSLDNKILLDDEDERYVFTERGATGLKVFFYVDNISTTLPDMIMRVCVLRDRTVVDEFIVDRGDGPFSLSKDLSVVRTSVGILRQLSSGALRYDRGQTLTFTEKAQALANLGITISNSEMTVTCPDGTLRTIALGGSQMQAGVLALTSGERDYTVNFPSAFSGTPDVIIPTVFNIVDNEVLMLNAVISAKSAASFSVHLDGTPDSGNYNLSWLASMG